MSLGKSMCTRYRNKSFVLVYIYNCLTKSRRRYLRRVEATFSSHDDRLVLAEVPRSMRTPRKTRSGFVSRPRASTGPKSKFLRQRERERFDREELAESDKYKENYMFCQCVLRWGRRSVGASIKSLVRPFLV